MTLEQDSNIMELPFSVKKKEDHLELQSSSRRSRRKKKPHHLNNVKVEIRLFSDEAIQKLQNIEIKEKPYIEKYRSSLLHLILKHFIK